MTSAMQNVVLERTRAALREVAEPFALLDEVSSSDTKNHELMQEVAASCAPAARRQELNGLCDELEMLLDQKVTGWLRIAVQAEIEMLVGSLRALRSASGEYSRHVARYAGLIGSIRAIADLARSPLDLPRTYVGATGYQKKRGTISDQLVSAMSGFGEALITLIGALENAISDHTGVLFRYRDA